MVEDLVPQEEDASLLLHTAEEDTPQEEEAEVEAQWEEDLVALCTVEEEAHPEAFPEVHPQDVTIAEEEIGAFLVVQDTVKEDHLLLLASTVMCQEDLLLPPISMLTSKNENPK